MKAKRTVIATILFVLSTATQALANQPPGPQVILSEVLILPTMILFSIIGGAYTVLNQIQKKRPRVILFLLAIVAIFLSGMHEGMGALVAIVFGFIALRRSINMIKWGFQARSSRENEEYLVDGTPWRLVSAGVVLIPVTIFLVGLAIAFVGYWPFYGQEHREAGLKDFVTYKLAYAKWEKNRIGTTFFRPIIENERGSNFKDFSPSNPNVQIEYSKDEKHFTVYMLPYEHFPFFPYNYFTSQPSYRADETGQIRMVMVNKRDKKCLTDAPIVMKVSEYDIKNKLRKIEDRVIGDIL